jgi:hypothetical protein
MTITNVTAIAPAGASASCYQAIIIQGPVAEDYNGLTQPPLTVYPIQNVTVADCDFGNPANTAQPYYLYNVQGWRWTMSRSAERSTIRRCRRDVVPRRSAWRSRVLRDAPLVLKSCRRRRLEGGAPQDED